MVHTVPLGDLTRLHVCLDNTGSSPEWYLEKVRYNLSYFLLFKTGIFLCWFSVFYSLKLLNLEAEFLEWLIIYSRSDQTPGTQYDE